MVKIDSSKYERKAFLFSFLIHATLFGSYLLYQLHNPIKVESKGEFVSMQLASFELPKQNNAMPTKPIEKPKSIEKPVEKVKTKTIEKIKPTEKPKAITPAKPIEKPLEKPKEMKKKEFTQPIQEKASKSHLQKVVEREQEKKAHDQNFIKTNFAIIRDKVLSTLIYPNVARRMGWVGVVEVAIVIDTNGKLLDAYVHKSSNKKLLDKAALKAAMKLKNQTLPKPQIVSTVILPISFRQE